MVARVGFDAVNSSAAGGALSLTASAGDTIIVGIGWYSTTVTITGVTVSSNSDATVRGSTQTGGPSDGRIAWYVLDNVTTGGALTVSYTLSGAVNSKGIAWAVSGANTSSAVDTTQGGTNAGSANPSVSITTANANSAIFAMQINGSGVPDAGSGYTLEDTETHAVWYEAAEYDIDVGAAGSKTVDFVEGSSNWVMHAIAINTAAAGGSAALSGVASTVPADGVAAPGIAVEL